MPKKQRAGRPKRVAAKPKAARDGAPAKDAPRRPPLSQRIHAARAKDAAKATGDTAVRLADGLDAEGRRVYAPDDPRDASAEQALEQATVPIEDERDIAIRMGIAPDDAPPHANGHQPNPNSGATTRSSLAAMAEQVFQDHRLSDQLTETQKIELLSRLNPDMVVQFATGLLLADEHDVPALNAWIYKVMELRVSMLGEGRKEIVEVSKGGFGGPIDEIRKRMSG